MNSQDELNKKNNLEIEFINFYQESLLEFYSLVDVGIYINNLCFNGHPVITGSIYYIKEYNDWSIIGNDIQTIKNIFSKNLVFDIEKIIVPNNPRNGIDIKFNLKPKPLNWF